MPVLLDFDGDNLNVLVTASITTQLQVVFSVQSYVGRVRSLTDQFRPKTPPASAVVARSRIQGGQAEIQAGTSTAHYDESGLLASRTCAVCAKLIPVKLSKRKRSRPSLQCSRDGCAQTYHLSCSRWANLSEEAIAGITTGKLDTSFYCDACMLGKPLCYWDFLAAHAQHSLLITENMFKSIGISRVPLTSTASMESESVRSQSQSSGSEHPNTETTTGNSVPDFEVDDRSHWSSIMLFDRNSNLVGVGNKCFRISASSRDPEMYIVKIKYIAVRAYPATRQERAISKQEEKSVNNTAESVSCKWEVSYARHGANDVAVTPGNAVFWPASFTREALAMEYTRRSLNELENAYLYEFQGEHPHDKMFSIGKNSLNHLDSVSLTTTNSVTISSNDVNGIWMTLTPRKGICMKLLATQIGHLKKLQEVNIIQMKKSGKPKASKAGRKPHFPGQQLNKIAVDTTN